MKLHFYKYHGTGNDFIMLDGRVKSHLQLKQKHIAHLCHRNFGIGADGLIILKPSLKADFEMCYYNADGNIGSMCGNGGRCAISFAALLGLIEKETTFIAYDGHHSGYINNQGVVFLRMNDVSQVKKGSSYFELNTGSPHYVVFKNQVKQNDVFKAGQAIRNSKAYYKEGINVNFVEIVGNSLFVRTYERGVENETLSCGTGVTATAIAYALKQQNKTTYKIKIKTLGGPLKVSFKTQNHQYFSDIFLSGPAQLVFEGKIKI